MLSAPTFVEISTMLRSLLGGLAASLMVLGTAQAAAPQVKTQAPGYYRLMLGEFEITALSDGTVKLPMDKMLHARPGQVEQQYARAFVPLPAEVSVNAYLVNTGNKLMLDGTARSSKSGCGALRRRR